MSKRNRNKSKKERQNWWYGLSEEEQKNCIKYWQKEKKTKRRLKSNKIMKKNKLSYDCLKCIHGITKSCTDISANGCIYFADELGIYFKKG